MPVSVSPSGTGEFWIILLWRDDRTSPPVSEIFTEFVQGIPTVTDDISWWVWQIFEQDIMCFTIPCGVLRIHFLAAAAGLVMGTHRRTIEKDHARCRVRAPDFFKQAVPDTELRPANEQLYCNPLGTKFR